MKVYTLFPLLSLIPCPSLHPLPISIYIHIPYSSVIPQHYAVEFLCDFILHSLHHPYNCRVSLFLCPNAHATLFTLIDSCLSLFAPPPQADACVEMEQRHFVHASLDYVFLLQEVQERKKFEFVEIVSGSGVPWSPSVLLPSLSWAGEGGGGIERGRIEEGEGIE